jgi:serine/threonine protein kinase
MTMEPTTLGGGRYELSGLLGRGGMAEVRMAQDMRLGRTVAIKRLRADLASEPTFQARFRREAQSAASLNHPAVVAVYDTGEERATDGSGLVLPYIVMEYVEGRTLRDILREGRKILPERALEITASVLDALDYSHRAGIIHRDIKPANVMLTPAGDVKVMDFGIARAISDSSATMTQTAAVIGTAQYLSPEQARGEQVDARSDLYSTGCLLFELLTGRPPFVGDSPVAVAYQHVREEPPTPSSIDPEISPAIDAITMKALTKPVEERYQSAKEMRADIDRALEGRPVLAPAVYSTSAQTEHIFPPPRRDPTATRVTTAPVQRVEEEPPPRRTGLWIFLGALVVLLLIAGFFVLPKLLADDAVTQEEVPDLRNDTVAEATTKLEAAGLTLGEQVPKNSDTIKKGHILSQSVAKGEMVDEGTAIDVTVSVGTKLATVPFVTGLSLDEATSKLESEGFVVDAQADEGSTERRNKVTSTDPEAGTSQPVGTKVTVFYSTGYVKVPNVVGKTQEEATSLLEAKGFDVVPSSVESDAPAGYVTDQDPIGNTPKPFGSPVVINISLGPTSTPPTSTTPETTPTTSTTTTSTSISTSGEATTSETSSSDDEQ